MRRGRVVMSGSADELRQNFDEIRDCLPGGRAGPLTKGHSMQRLLMLLDTDHIGPRGRLAGARGRAPGIAASASAKLRLAVQLEGDPMSGEAAREMPGRSCRSEVSSS